MVMHRSQGRNKCQKDLVGNQKGLSDAMFLGRSGEVIKSLYEDTDTVYINQDCAKLFECTGLN